MNSPLPRAVLVTFAVPDEGRAFEARSPRGPVKVIHTGVGDTPAGRRRLEAALETEEPRLVVSAGYAGGLGPELRVGDLVLAENFSDPGLLAAARGILADEPCHVGALTTQNMVAETAAAKHTLHAATGALAVDMETAWIAEICARVGNVPLLALRVVSDAAGQSFPVPNAVLFDAVRQRPRYVALPAWLALHPWRIGAFVKFVRGLGPARTRLGRALGLLLARL